MEHMQKNRATNSRVDASAGLAREARLRRLRVTTAPKPGMAIMAVLFSVVVAILAFIGGIFLFSSLWGAVLMAYAAQVSFILAMVGVHYVLKRSKDREGPYGWAMTDKPNDRVIDAEAPVWLSYQPKNETLHPLRRVAVSAASDRNSRTCCEWLAEYGFEVHLCSDHDTLIGDLITKPRRWSLVIVDADHIGGTEEVRRELEYIRSSLDQVPVILMIRRSDRGLGDYHLCAKQNMVLIKPFFRKSLFEAVEILNPVAAQDGH